MTNKTEQKRFDCVRSMREIRDRISDAIVAMAYGDLSRCLETRVREDSFVACISKSGNQGATLSGGHREGH